MKLEDFDTELPSDAEVERRERLRLRIAGLRELANFIEAHPDLPEPFLSNVNAFVDNRFDLARVAREPGIKWTKGASDDYFYLGVTFAGGIHYEINVSREQVCRKVITGTRIEPAKPEQVVEEFYWECDEPLLAGVERQS